MQHLQTHRPYQKTNPHFFDQSKPIKLITRQTEDDECRRARGDFIQSIVSIEDSSLLSHKELGSPTPRLSGHRNTQSFTVTSQKQQTIFFQSENIDDGRMRDYSETGRHSITAYGQPKPILATRRASQFDQPSIHIKMANQKVESDSNSEPEFQSETPRDQVSNRGRPLFFHSTAVPQIFEINQQQREVQIPPKTERSRTSQQPLSKLNLQQSMLIESVTQNTVNSDRERKKVDNVNAKTEKTESPVSVRHTKHKQPMMYVTRIARQNQVKREILAKKQANQQSQTNTERQFTLPQVQQLIAAKCNLSMEDLIKKLNEQECVEMIDVSYNFIQQVPLFEMTNHSHFLREMNFSHNQLSDIPEETFRNLQLLEVINLSSNQLNRLPESLFSLQFLQDLDFSNNRISIVQPKISLLKNLKTLIMEANPIAMLPNSIGYLNELQRISCDIFGYLPAQSKEAVKFNLKSTVLSDRTLEQAEDWTQNKNTIIKANPDFRFSKLMLHMQISKKTTSTFLELVYTFRFQISVEQGFITTVQTEQMENLLALRDFGFAGSLFHCLAANNHAYLINETVRQLKQVFGIDSGRQKQLRLESALRTVINSKNTFDQSPLEVSVVYQFEESAEQILNLLGTLIELDFKQLKPEKALTIRLVNSSASMNNDSMVASNDQSAFMKPGNQQSELIPMMPNPSKGNTQSTIFKAKATPNQLSQRQVLTNITQKLRQENAEAIGSNEEPYQLLPETKIEQLPKMHLLVVSLANANFGVSYKLLETMFLSSQRKFTNYQQLNKVENKPTPKNRQAYDLNCVDQDGLSFLHHLFANFSRDQEKAEKVFKLMLSQTSSQQNAFTQRLNSFNLKRISASQSPDFTFQPPCKPLLLNQVTNFGETPLAIAIEHQQNTAVDFAVRHNIDQIEAFYKSLRDQKSKDMLKDWMQTPAAKLAGKNKKRAQDPLMKSTSPRNGMINLAGPETNFFTQVFDLTEQKNIREITPIHRAVIKSNYSAVNSLLQSAITIRLLLSRPVGMQQTLNDMLPRTMCEQVLVDLFVIDSNGRTPRDYALKMVFMTKLLRQAESNQIWCQISQQNTAQHLYPLLPPVSSPAFGGLRKVSQSTSKAMKAKSTNAYLSHFFLTRNANRRDHSETRINHNLPLLSVDQKAQQQATDRMQQPCAKGVKKAKSMAFNNIQQRAEGSAQISTASQLMLSHRLKINTQVSKPTAHQETIAQCESQPTLQENSNSGLGLLGINSGSGKLNLQSLNSPDITPMFKKESVSKPMAKQLTQKGTLPTMQQLKCQSPSFNLEEDTGFAQASKAIQYQRKLLQKIESNSIADVTKSDLMCIEDLDDSVSTKKRRGRETRIEQRKQGHVRIKSSAAEETVECGFNVDDSDSDEELAALPSIQNEYTLQIKSFYQYKKPYLQQLQSNYFEDEFSKIMDEYRDPAKPEQTMKINPSEKINLLYSIVQRATNTSRLQDAKDVLDFLLYEIDTQINASSKSQPKPLTMGLGLFNSQFTNQFGGIKQPEVNPYCPNLNFLKDEVRHLRTQLDLLSKHMIHVPILPKQHQVADDESSISYTNRTPVETPNINEQESVSRCLDDADDDSTDKDLNYNEIDVCNFQSNTVALEAEVTDTDDCAEEAPYQNNRQNEESKAEALSRNTAIKMPSQHLSSNASVRDRSSIDNRYKLPMPQIPRLQIPRNTSSSHYTPMVFEDKRLSEFQVQASKSSKSNLNNLTVRNPARASFGPQTKFDVSSTTKGNKLAFLLDPKLQTRTKSSHETSVSAVPNKKPYTGQPKQKLSQPLNKLTSTVQSKQENVETDEGASNRPLNVLNSLNQINKEISVKTQMNFGDKYSSTTEHESCMQDTPNMDTVVVTEAVLVETPISKHKPVKVSDATALPGSFTDRQYRHHYFFRDSVRQETSTVQPNTDDIIQEESSPLLQLESNPGVLSEERETYSKHAQSILISESQANSNALGLVRRQAASRMSDRYGMGVNFNNLMKDDDTRLSIRTFPKVAVEKHTTRNQYEPKSPVSTNQMSPRLVASQQQLLIMLSENQSDIVMSTQRQESTISSNQACSKKLHQTTVYVPATFSASANEKSKREVGRTHNFQPSPSKMFAKRKPTNMQKQASSGQSSMGGRHRPSQQLPPKNCRNGLNQLIAQKTKRIQVSKQQQSTSAQSQPQDLIQHPGPKKKSKPQLQIQDQADQHRQVITIQLNEIVASNKTTEPKPSSHINVASSRSTVTSVHNFNYSATTEHRNSILKSSAATQESRRNQISASTQVKSK